jgi:hypothetical protein
VKETTIEFTHPEGNFVPPEGEQADCTEEIAVNLDWEPGESNWGADADGNRGIYVAGYFYPCDDPPEKCARCGHFYTEEEKEEINKLMEQKAEKYTEDYEPDYPEPDYPED